MIEKKDAALAALKDKTKVSSAHWIRICFRHEQRTLVTRKVRLLHEYSFCFTKPWGTNN